MSVGGSPLLDSSWRRVEAFDEAGPSRWQAHDAMHVDSDGEWEYDEEEELITFDLGPDSKRLVQLSQEYCVSGLETPTPYLQMGNLIFKGKWDTLIGTEILLHDNRQSGMQQHDLWPMAATPTDKRQSRPSGTTRRRIIFRQAVDMVKKEQDEAARASSNGKSHGQQTGLLTTKTHAWIRGKGWMRKEDAASYLARDAAARAGGETTSPDEPAVLFADVDAEETVADDELPPPDDTEFVDVTADDAEPAAAEKKTGRHKLTEDQRIRHQLFRALRAVDRMRQSGGDAAGEDGEEEEDDEDEGG